MSKVVKPPYWRRLHNSHPLARGLVGCWLFNEGTGNKVRDLSSYGNHGAINGALWAPARSGYGMKFSGAEYVECGNNDILKFGTGDFSVVVRAKVSQQGVSRIIHDHGVSGSFRYLINVSAANKIQFYIAGVYAISSDTYSLDAWYHLAAVRDGDNMYLHIYKVPDGFVEVVSNSGVGTKNLQPDAPLTFGRRSGTTAGYLNGVIELDLVYNRVLSAEEIAWLYREPYAIPRAIRSLQILSISKMVIFNMLYC